MSRAFRDGKTEKTKSALNLFYAVFFEQNSKESNGKKHWFQTKNNNRRAEQKFNRLKN
jgi:hypothetical protein